MKVNPIGDQVFIEIDVAEGKSAGGLFLPPPQDPVAKNTGKIIAVGDNPVIKVKPGDHVIMDKGMGRRIKLPIQNTNDSGAVWTGHKEYALIAYYDILAVMEG